MQSIGEERTGRDPLAVAARDGKTDIGGTIDRDDGQIVERIVAKSPFAEIYWSACRSLESGTATFGWSKPKYSNTLKSLGGP